MLATANTPISKRKSLKSPSAMLKKDPDAMGIKLQELQTENELLEKEITNWRKDLQTETKQFQESIKQLMHDNKRLKDLNHTLEDKLSVVTKEKLDLSLNVHTLKAQVKEISQERDKLEREYSKENEKLQHSNATLKESNRQLKKEKIDLTNQNALLQKKIKETETLCAKYERELSSSSFHGADAVSLKAKDYEIQRLSRSCAQKEVLEKTVFILEKKIKEIEEENTVLSMKINRLEVSHEYACELESALEMSRQMESVNEELVRENYNLRQMVGQQNFTDDISKCFKDLNVNK